MPDSLDHPCHFVPRQISRNHSLKFETIAVRQSEVTHPVRLSEVLANIGPRGKSGEREREALLRPDDAKSVRTFSKET